MENCVFCKIIKGEIPARKVMEDAGTFAFLDIQPANPGHALVVTKEHFPTLSETPDEALGALFASVKRVGRAAAAAVKASGFNVIVNNGAVAGQVISHVHVHVIPRFADDGHQHWAKRSVPEDKMSEIAAAIAGLTS